ncbi:MAG: hypothetical protein R8K49_06905 [Mariprofundaceae bacterium]
MALSIRPTDGLIHRLLQQNSRTAEPPRENSSSTVKVSDQVNISSEARKHTGTSTPANAYSSSGYNTTHTQEDLESRLLNLYQQPIESSKDK